MISKWNVWIGEWSEQEYAAYFMLNTLNNFLDALNITDVCYERPLVSQVYGHLIVIINKYTGKYSDEELKTQMFTKETKDRNIDDDWENRNAIRQKINNCFTKHDVYSIHIIELKDENIDYEDLDPTSKQKITIIATTIVSETKSTKNIWIGDGWDGHSVPFDAENANLIIKYLIDKTNSLT